MAKGSTNGIVRGKKGNTVFYKITNSNNKEKQGWREYTPVVKNPNTDGQKYQRAIMATVMRAYAAGKAIFDHAFEGTARGGDSMNRFRKLNAKALRAAVVDDIQSGHQLEDQVGRVVGPGIVVPVPWNYIISEGNYAQNLFTYDDGYKLPAATSAETVAAYALRNNLIAGDIYTLCVFYISSTLPVFVADPNVNEVLAEQFPCNFAFIRMTVKSGLADVNDAVATYGQLFDIEMSDASLAFSGATTIATVLDLENAIEAGVDAGSMGMIRSRDNEYLRSNTTMICTDGKQWGIASGYILKAWSEQNQRLGQSDLILEGGNF